MKTSHGLAIDGFVRGSATGGSTPSKISEASNILNPKAAGTKIKSAAQGVHQRAQRSQTLMRSAVKKPARNISNISKVVSPTGTISGIRKSAYPLHRQRVARAQSVVQSTQVQRFGHVKPQQKAPAVKPAQKVSPVESKAPVAKQDSTNSALYKPLPSMLTSATSSRQLERMLDEALLSADAHKNAFNKSARRGLVRRIHGAPKWASIGVSLFAVVLLTGYLAIHKIPQVAVKLAATQAHVNAHLPSYTPSGFSFATPIQYSSGTVSLKFKANGSTDRTFTLTQKTSDMDSRSLQDSVVPPNTQFQTSTVEGTTVYIYGDQNNAAWVNNGMEYQIHDSANLDSDQLLKIAGSL